MCKYPLPLDDRLAAPYNICKDRKLLLMLLRDISTLIFLKTILMKKIVYKPAKAPAAQASNSTALKAIVGRQLWSNLLFAQSFLCLILMRSAWTKCFYTALASAALAVPSLCKQCSPVQKSTT